MNLKPVFPAACLIALAVPACSTTRSVNAPHCGPAIEQSEVMVGDLRSLKAREDEIPVYIESHLGPYTVMSEDPVLVEKTGNMVTVYESTSLATLRASRAGCNLVLVVDEAGLPSMSASGSGRRGYWAVMFGTFEPLASEQQRPESTNP